MKNKVMPPKWVVHVPSCLELGRKQERGNGSFPAKERGNSGGKEKFTQSSPCGFPLALIYSVSVHLWKQVMTVDGGQFVSLCITMSMCKGGPHGCPVRPLSPCPWPTLPFYFQARFWLVTWGGGEKEFSGPPGLIMEEGCFCLPCTFVSGLWENWIWWFHYFGLVTWQISVGSGKAVPVSAI